MPDLAPSGQCLFSLPALANWSEPAGRVDLTFYASSFPWLSGHSCMPSERRCHTRERLLWSKSIIDQVQGPQPGPPSTASYFPGEELVRAPLMCPHLSSTHHQNWDLLGGSLLPAFPCSTHPCMASFPAFSSTRLNPVLCSVMDTDLVSLSRGV